jgi:hypothetical protein
MVRDHDRLVVVVLNPALAEFDRGQFAGHAVGDNSVGQFDILPALKREDTFVGQYAGRVSPKAP